jgi:hypothetical protein
VDFAGAMPAHMDFDHDPLQAIKGRALAGSTTGLASLGYGGPSALKAGESACQLAMDARLMSVATSHVTKAIPIIRIGSDG